MLQIWDSYDCNKEKALFVDPLWRDIYFTDEKSGELMRIFRKFGYPKRFIFLPINIKLDEETAHWFLMACDRETSQCIVYDSIRSILHTNTNYKLLFKRLKDCKIISNDTTLTVESSWYPQQDDAHSCGYRVLTTMLLIVLKDRLLVPTDRWVFNEQIKRFIS